MELKNRIRLALLAEKLAKNADLTKLVSVEMIEKTKKAQKSEKTVDRKYHLMYYKFVK